MKTPGGHLLVVEDDPEMRDLLRKVLEKSGYQVAAAGSGPEALALLPLQSFDLVVTDMHMPLEGGLSLLEAIPTASPGTPVIIVTAFGDRDSRLRATQLGAAAFISKPLRMAELTAAVRTALAGRGAAAA